MATAVVFRRDREGVIFAMFPELPADNYGVYCTCYQTVGQHCAADYLGCVANSRPARSDEYADLLTELKRRGYHLRVCKRAAPAMQERRRRLAGVAHS